jgi:hypothetical protein
MTQILAGLILMTVCAVIGVRLLALSWQTRKAPEFLIGASFVFAGALASLLDIVRQTVQGSSPEMAAALVIAARFFLQLGVTCVATFTWRVYRPADLAGRVLFGVLVGSLLLGFLGETWQGPMQRGAAPGPWFYFSLATRIAAYTWASIESIAYWLQLRRRARIGLSDPLVTNRVLLWSIGTFLILILWLRSLVQAVRGDLMVSGDFFVTTVVFACAATMWLAFFPPAFWKRLFDGTGQTQSA